MSQITVTSGTAGNAGSTAAELINAMAAEMLEVADYTVGPLESIFDLVPISNAKTMQWNRLERFSVEVTPTQLEEGVTPASIGISINQVTATLEQYGKVFTISELAQFTARHDVVSETMTRIGTHMGDTRHQLFYNVADAATNTFRINDRANDNAIAVGDTLSYEELVQVRGELAANGVPKFANGNYRIVVPTHMYNALLTDPNWLALNQFRSPEDIRNGYVGTLANMDVVETDHYQFRLTASTTAGNSSSIYSAFACGKGFAKATALAEADRKLYMDPPGSGGDTLRQRFELGWKVTFKSVITNQSFGRRVRASGANATAV